MRDLPLVLGGVRCGLRPTRPGNHTAAALNNTNLCTLSQAGKQPYFIAYLLALSGISLWKTCSTAQLLFRPYLFSLNLLQPAGPTESSNATSFIQISELNVNRSINVSELSIICQWSTPLTENRFFVVLSLFNYIVSINEVKSRLHKILTDMLRLYPKFSTRRLYIMDCLCYRCNVLFRLLVHRYDICSMLYQSPLLTDWSKSCCAINNAMLN